MLSYRKLYVDLVAEDGTVLIAYASWLGIGSGRGHPLAGYELYPAGGGRQVIHAAGPVEVARDVRAGLALRFTTARGPFALACLPCPAEAPEPPPLPAVGLAWKVLVARAGAVATGATAAPLRGSAYADWVTMTRAPRRLGLAAIRWGRAHLDRMTIVFNRVTLSSGEVWQAAFDGRRWSPRVEVDGAAIRCAPGALALTPERVLHQGEALDRERFPGRLSRAFARALAGPMVEVRTLARAALEGAGGGRALHEEVLCGGQASTTFAMRSLST